MEKNTDLGHDSGESKMTKDSGGRVQSGNEPLGRVQDDNDSIDRVRDKDDSKAGSGMTLGSSILQETLRTIRTGIWKLPLGVRDDAIPKRRSKDGSEVRSIPSTNQ